MLIRAYRLTDKLSVALLKSLGLFSALLLERAFTLRTVVQQGTGGFFKLLLALVLGVFVGIRWILQRIYAGLRNLLYGIWTVLAWLWNHLHRILGALLHLTRAGGKGAARIGSRTASAAVSGRSKSMVQEVVEKPLAEDPLRVQNRILSAMIVVVLMILIAIIIWATGHDTPDATTPPVVVNLNIGEQATPSQQAPPAVLDVATPVPTATDLPEVLQVRGSLAYVVRERGQTDIWAIEVGNRTPIRIVASKEDDRDPAWSHSGTRLAYASRQQDSNWDLYIYDLLTGSTTRMTYNLAFEGRPKWSPDDAYLLYEAYQNTTHLDIFVMRSDGSEPPVRLGASSDAPDFSPAWSPDGRRIAFTSWRDGNQDIYIFSLDTQETYNLTQTPNRHEDYPVWSPDGQTIAFSAIESGIEMVFIQNANTPGPHAEAFRRGRTPAWSPPNSNVTSVVFAVDAAHSTFITVAPFDEQGVVTEVIQAPAGATMPVWTNAPLPPALVNSGGLPLPITEPLYTEQVNPTNSDPPYNLGTLVNISGIQPAYLSDRVNDSFNALRTQVNNAAGTDFLGTLSDALWDINRRPQPGEPNRNWHKTGRAFSFNRNLIVGFPPPIEVVREDRDLETYWRVYVRVDDDAQTGQLGEPLRQMPWDFQSRDQGDVQAYEQGGRLRNQLPGGYYIDLTQITADYGWERVAAGQDWRDNFNARNYWTFQKRDGLAWYDAMREIYTEGELGGWVPTPTPAPLPTTTQQGG